MAASGKEEYTPSSYVPGEKMIDGVEMMGRLRILLKMELYYTRAKKLHALYPGPAICVGN